MQPNGQNNVGPTSGNPVGGGNMNPAQTPNKSGDQNPRPKNPTLEEIIFVSLKASAGKAGLELLGVVVPERIEAATELVAKREAKAIIVKAINYAKGIAADKKFHGHHLLKELGIKMPSSTDGDGNTAGKPGRKTDPAKPGKAQSNPAKAGEEKPKQGNAGEESK
jgi:hypothetical protein